MTFGGEHVDNMTVDLPCQSRLLLQPCACIITLLSPDASRRGNVTDPTLMYATVAMLPMERYALNN